MMEDISALSGVSTASQTVDIRNNGQLCDDDAVAFCDDLTTLGGPCWTGGNAGVCAP
jgi:hypothetical protein